MAYVNINHRNKINIYNQNNDAYGEKFKNSCAFICAAMVLRIDPMTLAKTHNHADADWWSLFTSPEIREEFEGVPLSYILEKLKQGFPVIARTYG